MSLILGVLVIVNDNLLAELRDDICVEELDISCVSRDVHFYLCFVHFVYPVGWGFSLHIFQRIFDVRADCIAHQRNIKRLWVVD